jgi:hypothetical protein
METLDEIEERLATGGPSWEQVVQEVAGWDGRDGDPVPVALERAGLSRLRSKAWLRANPARRKELDAAAEVREERRKELVMATMMGIMVDLEAPVSARLKAGEIVGREVGLFKDQATERVADSLESILARSWAVVAAAPAAGAVVDTVSEPVLRLANADPL